MHTFFAAEETSGDFQFCSQNLIMTLKYAKENVICDGDAEFDDNVYTG